MRPILALTAMTMREVLRKRIVLVPALALLALVALVLLFPLPGGNALGEAVAYSAQLFRFALTLAVIAACAGAIADEIEAGTVLLLVMRPIRRSSIVVGKLFGIAVMTTAAMLVWGIIGGGLMSLRSGEGWVLGSMLATSLAGVLAVMLMGAVAITLSAFMSTRNTLILTVLIWIASSAANGVYAIFHDSKDPSLDSYRWLGTLAHGVTLAVPRARLEHFSAQVVGHGARAGSHVSVLQVLGAAAAIAAWSWLAVLVFERRRSLS